MKYTDWPFNNFFILYFVKTTMQLEQYTPCNPWAAFREHQHPSISQGRVCRASHVTNTSVLCSPEGQHGIVQYTRQNFNMVTKAYQSSDPWWLMTQKCSSQESRLYFLFPGANILLFLRKRYEKYLYLYNIEAHLHMKQFVIIKCFSYFSFLHSRESNRVTE